MNWKCVTHFGAAEMIFLSSSRTGHVVLPSSSFLSLDRKQTLNEKNKAIKIILSRKHSRNISALFMSVS